MYMPKERIHLNTFSPNNEKNSLESAHIFHDSDSMIVTGEKERAKKENFDSDEIDEFKHYDDLPRSSAMRDGKDYVDSREYSKKRYESRKTIAKEQAIRDHRKVKNKAA